jgi:pimeloyl-ACP methyl ester carboxylesterase
MVTTRAEPGGGRLDGATASRRSHRVRVVGAELCNVRAHGVDFAVLHAGPPDGPLALCLHGFPDSAHTWRHLLPVLAEAGFHACAPFSRGYRPTAVPDDGRYQTGALVADASALHEVLGGDERAVIVGHDWGAFVAYGAASHQPARWSRVVGMAVPPGGALGGAIVGNLGQLKRSWYMFFFQHPLADVVVANDDLAFIDMIWRDWSPGLDCAEDVLHAKECLRDPANLAAALGYYRSVLGAVPPDPALNDEQAATNQIPPQPTLYLHGADDGCVGRDVVDAALASGALDAVRTEIVPACGHFLQLDDPPTVNSLILEHVTS